MNDADEIGRLNTARLMEEMGLSQAEVVRRAVAAGHTFDTATLNRVLRGRQPIRGHLEKVADALGVSMSSLLMHIPSVDSAPGPSEGDADGAEEAPGTGSATADAALCHWQIGLVQ